MFYGYWSCAFYLFSISFFFVLGCAWQSIGEDD